MNFTTYKKAAKAAHKLRTKYYYDALWKVSGNTSAPVYCAIANFWIFKEDKYWEMSTEELETAFLLLYNALK